MRRLKESRITRGVGFLLAPVLLFLAGSLSDPALARQKIACDFLTGSGRATASGDDALLSFGLASGVEPGSFWGHLAYLDYGSMLKMESTSITNYAASIA